MIANIEETKGFKLTGQGELVEWDDIVKFDLKVDLMLDTADEPFLVIFDDGSWHVTNAVEAHDLIEDGPTGVIVHQAVPFNAIFREFIAFEASREVLNARYATPVPA